MNEIHVKETMKKGSNNSGSDGIIKNFEECKKLLNSLYPIMLKATAGGGGKGMRLCDEESERWDKRQTRVEAFGNDGMYMEKFIEDPRHIEIQTETKGKSCFI